MTDTETPMPTINSFYDNETSTEYAVEDTVARARAEAAQEAAEAAQEAAGAGIVTDPVWVQHRNTYRGQYLGDSYTDEQKAMVAAGTFDDLYIGDYWTINGVDWLIADINYWLGTGDTRCTENHLVIVPSQSLYTAKINDSDTTNGGYLGSKMRSQNLDSAKTSIKSAFGNDFILSHREYLTNAVSSGMASASTWVDSEIELMNQIMVYGSMVVSSTVSATNIPYTQTIDKTQLALFKLRPDYIMIEGGSVWLRDIASSSYFTSCFIDGRAVYYGASNQIGVRPSFGIIG